MSHSVFGWSLPPGCTMRDIEDAAGPDYDGPPATIRIKKHIYLSMNTPHHEEDTIFAWTTEKPQFDNGELDEDTPTLHFSRAFDDEGMNFQSADGSVSADFSWDDLERLEMQRAAVCDWTPPPLKGKEE